MFYTRNKYLARLYFSFAFCVLNVSNAVSQPVNEKLAVVLSTNGMVADNYIGGFYKSDVLGYPVFKSIIPKNVIKISDSQGLISILKTVKPYSVIYLDDNSTFDLSGYSEIVIPANVTLMSGRGINKSKGALIYTKTLKTFPLFQTGGEGVKLIGLRLQGPDTDVINPILRDKYLSKNFRLTSGPSMLKGVDPTLKRKLTYGIDNSQGIKVQHINVLIQNCEIFGWSHAGIYLNEGNATISYNYIHDNQRMGLGYGIMNDRSDAQITANIFRDNRHGIAGTGRPGTSYTASFNIFILNKIVQGHQIDMHGGKDRKEDNNIAGDDIRIVSNLIFCNSNPAILIRGNPQKSTYIDDNIIIETSRVYLNGFMNLNSFKKVSLGDKKSIIVRQNKDNNNKGIYIGENDIFNNPN